MRHQADQAIATLHPQARISELEHENAMLRHQRDREILHVAQRELAQDIERLHQP